VSLFLSFSLKSKVSDLIKVCSSLLKGGVLVNVFSWTKVHIIKSSLSSLKCHSDIKFLAEQKHQNEVLKNVLHALGQITDVTKCLALN
jgi:hypothetical protein